MSDDKNSDLNKADVEPSDYLRKRRHQSVNDLRDSVYQARMRAYQAMTEGSAESIKNNIIRAAVENYITELEPLLVNTEKGEQYWKDAELGTVTISPPDGKYDYKPFGYAQDLIGLRDFQDAPKHFSGTFQYEISSHVSGEQTKKARSEVSMPESVSWVAFRYANQFAYEIGLDIDHKDEIAVEADPF